MVTQADLAAEVAAARDEFKTVLAALNTKITDLTAQIAAGGAITPDLQTQADGLKADADAALAAISPPAPTP